MREKKENFEDSVSRYEGLIRNFFERRGCGEESRDLTQLTFLKAYKHLKGFLGRSSLKTWLMRIAKNNYANHIRSKTALKNDADVISYDRSEVPSDRIQGFENPSRANPLKALLTKEESQRLQDALEQLPEQMRQCIYLYVYQGLKYREIADVMQLRINTVKSHIFQAKERLRKRLTEFEADFDLET